MNIAQKISTALFMALFILGTTAALSNEAKGWQPYLFLWIILVVLYSGMMAICAPARNKKN